MGTLKNSFSNLTRTVLSLVILLSLQHAKSQIQLGSPAYSACPNETVVVTVTWPNVGGVFYTLQSPPGSLPASGALPSTSSFTISSPGPGNVTYTLSGTGTSLTGPVTSTVLFNLSVVPPAALTITNQIFYCPGQTATFVAPIGGNSYNVYGSNNINILGITSNIINFGPLGPQHNGTYTITSVGSCTAFGTTTISIAPNTPVAISAPTNICQWMPGEPISVLTLTSAIITGINYQWYGPLNQALGGAPAQSIFSMQPIDGGVYTVQVDFPWGPTLCPRTATTQVNVVSKSPVVVSASPGNSICQGDKLNFSATAGSAVGWSWTGPQAFASSISNPNINPVAANNSGTYVVTALFTNNIITCSQTASTVINVVAVNQPIISMPTSTCQGPEHTIPISVSANGANTFNWVGPNGFSVTTSNTIITNPQPNMSGIYYVTAIFGNPITATCAATSSAQVNVVPVNTISIIPTAPVCEPANGYLQASAVGANSYYWVGPNGYNAVGSNAVVYYPTPSASGIYTVTAYFGGGNITCPRSTTAQLVVNPVLNFTLVPRQQNCYNTAISVSGPVGATSYSWTSSNGFKSNTKDISFSSVQPKDAGTYTLVISLGPCTTSASTIIDVLTPVQFTLTPNNRTVCQGDSTVLEAGVSGGSQNYAYVWNPAVFIPDPVGSKKVAVPLGPVIYNVVAHDIACPNYTIAHSFSVNVNFPPKPDLQLSKTSGCAPFCQVYDAKVSGTSAITTYDFGGLRKFQGDVIKTCLSEAGTYPLTIYTTAKGTGCKGKFLFDYPIVVFPKPGATISWSPEEPTPDDEVVFTASVKNGPVSYFQWSFLGGAPSVPDTAINYSVPGSDTSNVSHPMRRYTKMGSYPVLYVVRNDKDCVDSIARFVKIIDNFNLYIPNAFTPNDDGLNDVFLVKGVGVKTENFSMEITDRWGDLVYSTSDITKGWDGKVNNQAVKDAVYIYKIRAVGMNGEGRKEFVGTVTVLK